MKTTLVRLCALLLTFSVGIAIPFFFKGPRPIESSLAVSSAGVGRVVSSRCPGAEEFAKGGAFVISVPNDTEIYLGKRKVALAEISESVRKSFGHVSLNHQLVFIKSAGSVRFGTLSHIADQLRNANVNCMEFIMDKRKGAVDK